MSSLGRPVLSFVFLRLPSKFPSQISHPDWPPAFCLKRPWLACIHVQIGPKSWWSYASMCISVSPHAYVGVHECVRAIQGYLQRSSKFYVSSALGFLSGRQDDTVRRRCLHRPRLCFASSFVLSWGQIKLWDKYHCVWMLCFLFGHSDPVWQKC